jgi:GNS1/SUR4 family
VPQRVKSSLTTLQISQFIVGIAFASMHLFFHYSVPVSTPYTWTKTVSSVISAASAAATSAASEMASQASAVAEAPGLGLFLQKMLYRALGEEGLARRVGQQFKAKTPTVPQPHINVTEAIQRETKWRTQYMFIPCIDTEGQAFAIWLNVFYLAPLTLLFAQFFIRSYLSGPRSASKRPKKSDGASKVSADTARDASRQQEKPRATENGTSHTSEGKSGQRSASNTPSKGGERRRVSASIEQMVSNFENTEAEATDKASKAHGGEYHASSRPSPVQESKSTTHRSLFLETRDYVRSVDSSQGAPMCRAKSSGIEHQDRLRYIEVDGTQEEVDELERRAEASVRQAREAAGGQGARTVEDMLGEVDMSYSEIRPTEADVVAEDAGVSNEHEEVRQEESNEPSANGSNQRPHTPLPNDYAPVDTIQQSTPSQPHISELLGIPPFPSPPKFLRQSPCNIPLPPSPERSPSRLPAASLKAPSAPSHVSDASRGSPVRRPATQPPSRIPVPKATPNRAGATSPIKRLLTPATTTTLMSTAEVETPAPVGPPKEGGAVGTLNGS